MVDNAMRQLCLQFAEAAVEQHCSVMRYCIPEAVRPSVPQLLDLARCLAAIMLADQSEQAPKSIVICLSWQPFA